MTSTKMQKLFEQGAITPGMMVKRMLDEEFSFMSHFMNLYIRNALIKKLEAKVSIESIINLKISKMRDDPEIASWANAMTLCAGIRSKHHLNLQKKTSNASSSTCDTEHSDSSSVITVSVAFNSPHIVGNYPKQKSNNKEKDHNNRQRNNKRN